MRSTAILWIYVAASVANVFSHILHHEDLNKFTKPLLMPLLLFYIYHKSIGKTTLKVLLLSGAILFLWFADIVLLSKSSQSYFILRLGLLLTAQIIYILALRKASYQNLKWKWYHLVFIILFCALLFHYLLPVRGITVPSIIYKVSILSMVITARIRKEATSVQSYNLVLSGSVLFLISDFILIINAQITPLPYSPVFVISSYCVAQFLIVEGILKHADHSYA